MMELLTILMVYLNTVFNICSHFEIECPFLIGKKAATDNLVIDRINNNKKKKRRATATPQRSI